VRHIRSIRARKRNHASVNNDVINWPVELQAYVMDGQWDSRRLGARPLHAGCRAPADLVARYFPNGTPAYGPDGPHPEFHEPIGHFKETNAELDEVAETKDAEATIARLAKLNDVAYARKRKQAATDLKIPLGEVDKLVRKHRAKLKAEAEAAPLYEHWNVEPWPKPVDGGVLVRALAERLRRHVVMTTDQATAVALWIMLTWVHERAAVHSPLLLATSAEANSGKSTLLGLLGFLVRRALLSVSISGPALFRSIEKWCPTFVIDEADTVLVNNEDLKEVINSGWTRGQNVIRCDPETNDPRPYSTFCPKAIGMKGRKLPDTTLSRAIIIELQRKLPDETVTDFDHLDDKGLARLRQQLARWAADNAAALAKAMPEIPPGFFNRTKANWKLLLAVAESAGGESKRCAWQAAGVIEKVKATFEASLGTQLLTDIRPLCKPDVTHLFSRSIVEHLTTDRDKPWIEYWHGKPITQRQLATLLGNFSIISETVRIGAETAKGYRCSSLEEAFERYLNPQSDGNSHSDPSQRHNASATGTSSTFRSVTHDQMLRIENEDLSHGRSGCDAVTDENPEVGYLTTTEAPPADLPEPASQPSVETPKSLWDDLDIPPCLRRPARLGPPAISSGPDDDLGDFR
jgi:putative DNA primase/helicase